MTDCVVCNWIKEKKNMLFEDDDVFVMLAPEPSSPGNMFVIPKKHIPILEAIPDSIVSKLFDNSNKASICAFESLGAQGTNILVQNGIPAGQKVSHCIIQIIPRFQDDKLALAWQPSQLNPEQLEELMMQFTAEEPEEVKVEEGKEDHRVSAIRRIP